MLTSISTRGPIEIGAVVSTLCKPVRKPQRELFRADEDLERDLKEVVEKRGACGAICLSAAQLLDPKKRNDAFRHWSERRGSISGRPSGLPIFISRGEQFLQNGETMDVFADILRRVALEKDSFSGFIQLPAAELDRKKLSPNLNDAFEGTGIQLPRRVVYSERVKRPVPERLLSTIRERVAASQWASVEKVDPAFVSTLAAIIYNAMHDADRSRPHTAADTMVDPVTNLKLPPDPRDSFKLRVSKYGRRLSASEFLKLEWADYTSHHLMYAEFIRTMDPALYFAMAYEARSRVPSVPLVDFMLENGVLAKSHVVRPPADFERQSRLLQSVRLRTRGQDLVSVAKELENDLIDR
jgi:hypothetical protein